MKIILNSILTKTELPFKNFPLFSTMNEELKENSINWNENIYNYFVALAHFNSSKNATGAQELSNNNNFNEFQRQNIGKIKY